MSPIHFSLLVHFVGVGMIFAAVFGGWMLQGQYRKAHDWAARAQLLRAVRAVGLLSPAGAAVLLLSGIANMAIGGYSLFSAAWLSAKLVFFLLLLVLGVVGGISGARRGKLAAGMAAGTAPEGAEHRITLLQRQQRTFSLVQFVLILIILMLSIVRPLA